MATLVMVAGYPGTGKSYFCGWLLDNWPNLCLLSPDDFKENFWDAVGYDNQEEKDALVAKSWQDFYVKLEELMQVGKDICLDYPFSEKQKGFLQALLKKYTYEPVTIRLVGNLEVLCQRQLKRDLASDRHLGHIMTHYHKGDVLVDRSKADSLVSHDEFIARCLNRGYGEFRLGVLQEVDVSDFDRIPYDALHDFLDRYLSKNR